MKKNEIAKKAKERLEKQITYLTGYFHAKELKQSLKAMELAIEVHTGKRKGGQPEVSHQFELISYGLPIFEKYEGEILDNIIAALFLHDIPEDADPTLNYIDIIKTNFNKEVFELVMAVTKPREFKKTQKEYISYYENIGQIPFGIVVKMIDRLHNLESMLEAPDIFNLQKRIKYIEEVETHMIPLSKKIRKENIEYYQVITFLIKELKTYIKFLKRINELDK